MNEHEQQLLNLVLKHVEGDKKGVAENLLSSQFSNDKEGKTNLAGLAALAPQLAGLAKPEHSDAISGLISSLGQHPDNIGGLMSMVSGLMGGGSDNADKDNGLGLDDVAGLLKKFL